MPYHRATRRPSRAPQSRGRALMAILGSTDRKTNSADSEGGAHTQAPAPQPNHRQLAAIEATVRDLQASVFGLQRGSAGESGAVQALRATVIDMQASIAQVQDRSASAASASAETARALQSRVAAMQQSVHGTQREAQRSVAERAALQKSVQDAQRAVQASRQENAQALAEARRAAASANAAVARLQATVASLSETVRQVQQRQAQLQKAQTATTGESKGHAAGRIQPRASSTVWATALVDVDVHASPGKSEAGNEPLKALRVLRGERCQLEIPVRSLDELGSGCGGGDGWVACHRVARVGARQRVVRAWMRVRPDEMESTFADVSLTAGPNAPEPA